MSVEPSPRFGHFSAAVVDQLYVWGGLTKDFLKEKNSLASTIHCFHPVLESWEHHKCSGSVPPALYWGACTSTKGNLYLYGGWNGPHCHGCLYQLDTESLKWQELSSAGPMRKVGCGMVSYGTKLVVFGGYGILSGPIQPGTQFLKDTKYTSGSGYTNELHIFDLEAGKRAGVSIMLFIARMPPLSGMVLPIYQWDKAPSVQWFLPHHGRRPACSAVWGQAPCREGP